MTRRLPSPEIDRDPRSEIGGPAANGFIADFDPALSQHLLDIAQAEREPEVGPDNVFGWIAGRRRFLEIRVIEAYRQPDSRTDAETVSQQTAMTNRVALSRAEQMLRGC